MTTHDPTVRDHSIEPGSDRSFGLIVGGILCALGIYPYLAHGDASLWLLVPGSVLLGLGLLRPRVLHPLNLAWTHLGSMLGRIVTPMVMLVVYVVAVVPTGLVLRGLGRNLLGLKKHEQQSSYWIRRDPPGPPAESLRDQF